MENTLNVKNGIKEIYEEGFSKIPIINLAPQQNENIVAGFFKKFSEYNFITLQDTVREDVFEEENEEEKKEETEVIDLTDPETASVIFFTQGRSQSGLYELCFDKDDYIIVDSSELFAREDAFEEIPIKKIQLKFLRESFEEEEELNVIEDFEEEDWDYKGYGIEEDCIPIEDECILYFDSSVKTINNPYSLRFCFNKVPEDFEYKIKRTEFTNTTLVFELKNTAYFTMDGEIVCCNKLTENYE